MLTHCKNIAIWLPLLAASMPGATSPLTISLNAVSATLRVGGSKTFEAKLANTTNKAVTWRVNKVPGGNASLGTIDKDGKYVAPAKVPSPNVISIDAVSAANPLKMAAASVTLLQAVPSISALSVPQINTTHAFTLTIAGANFATNAGVSFSDNTVLTVTSRSATQITVRGTSASPAGTHLGVTVTNPNPGEAVSSAKTLTVAAPITVAISPKTKTLRGLTSLKFGSAVSNTATKTVTWWVNGVAGGNASLGTVAPDGTYTAPAAPPASVTVSAKSTEDDTRADAAVVTLLNPVPAILTATSPITAGAKVTITVSGTGFVPAAQATLGNTAMTVKWISSSQLSVSGAVDAEIGGVAALVVKNPNPGASSSNTFAITVKSGGNALSYAAARRFLQHATWGPTAASIAHLQSIGINAWLAEQFSMPTSTYSLPVDDTSNLSSLQEQFFNNALTGSDQLRQRVAFALGQIAVVSGIKLGKYSQMMPYQQMLLNDAFGTYHQFLTDVTLSPAMGHYLDMVNNNVPSGTQSANENYARELMQLFSIGLTQLKADGSSVAGAATYTQDDIRALAKVMTGWTYAPCFAATHWVNPACFQSSMVAFENHHDQSAKLFLGVNIQTGSAAGDLEMALQTIEQYQSPQSSLPNIAPFVSLRLIQHLVTSNPTKDYVSRVASVFARSGGDLRQTVAAVLTDPAAGNDGSVLPADQGHLTEPALYAVGLLRALGAKVDSSAMTLAYATSPMGQNLFYSPSVFNYYLPFYTLPGTATVAPEFQILSQSTAFYRANFAYRAVSNQLNANIKLDLSNIAQLAADTNAATQNASLTAALNAVSQALLGTPMPPEMLTAMMPAMLSTKDAGVRARNAVFLLAASPQYQVQR